MFKLEEYIFIYKTMILVKSLYEAGVYDEDKEVVLETSDRIMKTLEAVYPIEIGGLIQDNE